MSYDRLFKMTVVDMVTPHVSGEEEEERSTTPAKRRRFWTWFTASLTWRLLLILFPLDLNLAHRPEVSTPVTSLRRLAEGYWLKQSSMSPYAGSMYHGSPLLLAVLGPFTVGRNEGPANRSSFSLLFLIVDVISAMLIRAIGRNLQMACKHSLETLVIKPPKQSGMFLSEDVAALAYLWNPFTTIACMGYSSSPIENLLVILALYGASARIVPLAAFGWVMATHLSLYPAILILPVVLLLGYGPDTPPQKSFLVSKEYHEVGDANLSDPHQSKPHVVFAWRLVMHFFFWISLWAAYVLLLCGLCLKHHGSLREMFHRTYGFIMSVEDLSPNIGVMWYFFAEVFTFFRNFFLIVFHVNILFMILPLAIRLSHRPCFLAFIYVAISSMLKSYPSVGDVALYMGLFGLFIDELAEMQFTLFLFFGYLGISLLGPVMYNLWIWRGTGNANFYFATSIAYACLQIVLIVESTSAMLKHDHKLKTQFLRKLPEGQS